MYKEWKKPANGVVVEWDEDDQQYRATIPGVKGLSAFGDSPEEARREAVIALGGIRRVAWEDKMYRRRTRDDFWNRLFWWFSWMVIGLAGGYFWCWMAISGG